MVVQFDPAQLVVRGEPVRLVDGVLTKGTLASDFAVSRDGTLAYVPGDSLQNAAALAAQPMRSLVWVDRRGREEAIDAPPRPYVYARLAPDGTRVALDVRDQDADIWIWDLEQKTLSRVTSDPTLETSPIWTPDSRSVLFGSQRAGASNIFRQAADGSGAAERLTSSPSNQVPTAIAADGHRVIYYAVGSDRDLMVLHLDNQARSEPLLITPFAESNGDLSPDGRWIAYQSNESGQMEIYVRPFPKADAGRFPISTSGGHRPRWAHSGRELFYFNTRNELMVVPVESGGAFTAGNPAKILDAKYFAGNPFAGARTYDVSYDDSRFLMIKGPATDSGAGANAPRDMVIVLNWREELKTRIGIR
jgi:serine/threonine-protein kinase